MAPVLPSWLGFTATRRFRGTTYEITVRRGPSPGMRADVELIEGTLLPLASPGMTETVDLVLPAPAQ